MTARFVPVVLGIRDEDQVEISAGLEEGARVVTTGAMGLRDGDRIVPSGGGGRPGGPGQGREGGRQGGSGREGATR